MRSPCRIVRDGREAVYGGRGPGVPCLENGARKFRMVGRVREMLSLERDPVALPVQAPVLAHHGDAEKVAGVEMNSGLGRRELEHSSRSRVLESSGRAQLSALPAERESVVVAASDR